MPSNPAFPQLLTGAIAQYPFARRIFRQSIATENIGGELAVRADGECAEIEWELSFEGLTSPERDQLCAHFEACEGRLHRFLFLDPCGNLLRWSEDHSKDAWIRPAWLGVTGGVADPLGSTRATRLSNSGAAGATLAQTIQAPNQPQLCLSVYLRAESASQVRLFVQGAGGAERMFTPSSAWSRQVLYSDVASENGTITVGVEIAGGGAVETWGWQLDAQPEASVYRRSGSQGGVHPNARYMDDRLQVVSEAPGLFSTRVRIRSRIAD